MKRSATCPDISLASVSSQMGMNRIRSAPMIHNGSQLYRACSSSSLSSLNSDHADVNTFPAQLVHSADEPVPITIIRDVSSPRGIASITCIESSGILQAPELLSETVEDLERCMFIPLQEEDSWADSIWKNIVEQDARHTILKRFVRRKRWMRSIKR